MKDVHLDEDTNMFILVSRDRGDVYSESGVCEVIFVLLSPETDVFHGRQLSICRDG